MTTYFYHTTLPDVRIKVCKKIIVWERLEFVDYDDVEKGKAWRYHMRHSLPVSNADRLRKMYNLPQEVVAKLNSRPL